MQENPLIRMTADALITAGLTKLASAVLGRLGAAAMGALGRARSHRPVNVNVWGEGEARPNYTDVAPYVPPVKAYPRPSTGTIPSGSAGNVFLRDAPTDAATVQEIVRMTGSGKPLQEPHP
jgi:hypothetical protein